MEPMYTYRNLAKVRVAGSNPVFRSKHNHRSGTLLGCLIAFWDWNYTVHPTALTPKRRTTRK